MEKLKIRVTTDKTIMENENYTINVGEYRVHRLEFDFSDEYNNNLIKKAIFENSDNTIEVVILNDECDIPYEILGCDYFELKVFAYESDNNELIIRYSPSPIVIYLREGSYQGNNEIITPSQFEQYEQALNNGLEEIDEKLTEVDNLDIDASKSGTVSTVTITKKNGTVKSVQINDGERGADGKDGQDYVITQQDYNSIANIVEQEIYVPSKTSELTNDSGFIDRTVNDLTNYYLSSNTYTKSEVNELVSQLTGLQIEIVETLPTTGIKTNTIYMVLKSTSETNNIYDEYLYINNNWELIGSTEVDLSNYQTKIDSSHKLSSDLVDDTNNTNLFVTSNEKETWNNKSDFSGSYADLTNKPTIPTALSDLADDSTHRLVTDTEKTTWSGKQDTLTAGTNITISSNTISATDTIYSNATTETAGLMSSDDKTKLNGISSGAEVNVQANWNETDNTSDAYIQNKPNIPTVNNATLTIQKNSTTVDTFTANASVDKTINITVPTDTQDLTNGAGYTTNTGTITSVKMNGSTVSSSGEADLGTVITQHQDISGKLDTSKVKNEASTTAGDVYDVRYINTMLGNIETLLSEV